jgi:hypothetical protein
LRRRQPGRCQGVVSSAAAAGRSGSPALTAGEHDQRRRYPRGRPCLSSARAGACRGLPGSASAR